MKSTTAHDIEPVLANRNFFYTLFGRVFGDAPTAEFIELLGSEPVRDQLAFAAERDAELGEAIAGLSVPSADAETVSKLQDDYTYLFLGPAKPPAPLWESLYVNGEALLFQESTLKVRQAYHAAGFMPAGYPHVADDHIAIELNFLAALSGAASAACGSSEVGVSTDVSRCREILGLQRDFLEKHLLVWIGRFASQLGDQRRTGGFYPQIARISAAYAAQDVRAITAIDEAL